MIPFVIAFGAPFIKVVVAAVIFNVGAELIDSGKSSGLIGVNGISGAATGDFAIPAVDFYEGGVAGFIYCYSVTTWSQNSKCEIRCIDFDGFVFVESFYANVDGAFGEANLRRTDRPRLRKEKPVSPPMRTALTPKRNSARAPLSVQSLSPVVTGRFAAIETQSSCPPAERKQGRW